MNSLWYKEPAKDWNSALPVGNGRLGAMVYGRPGYEIIQLNEESVWSGTYHDRNNRSCKKSLPEIRKLIREGRVQEAQELGYETMTGNPDRQSVLLSAGELHLDFYTEQTRGLEGPLPLRAESFKNYSLYKRELDLNTAIASTSFLYETSMPSTADFSHSHGSSISYTSEVFVPAGLDVIVVHLTASTPKSIYFRANFERGNLCTETHALAEDTIVMRDTHGIPFAAVATAVASGGKVCTRGANIIVEGADEAIIYIDIQTSFKKRVYFKKGGSVHSNVNHQAARCENRALAKVCFASCGIFADIKSAHIAEYAALKNAAGFELEDENQAKLENLPVNELLEKHAESPALAQLYWNFSRYLLISSSRNPGILPATNQGLWNKEIDPSKGASYPLNLNTEMTYWPANMTGLSHTELPLIKLFRRSFKHGTVTAREMYGADGFTAHNSLDVWGDTAPQGQWLPGTYWCLGGAWLATHIWEHYEYTRDKKFLKKNIGLMKRTCDFFVNYLVASDDGKHLVLNPSVSPESTYYLPKGGKAVFSAGTDMDNRILEHLFESTIKAMEELGVSEVDVDLNSYKTILGRIEKTAVTSDNCIREWPVKCEAADQSSSYIGQLYGLFPGHSINYNRTPELAEAAKNTIQQRAGKSGAAEKTGTEKDSPSKAWIMNYWASLHEGNQALDTLTSIFKTATKQNLFHGGSSSENGSIDGNLGALGAMTRLIVQSEIVDGAVEVSLLPALPDAWKNGKLTGVVLKGNLRLDIEWKDSRIVSAKIYTLEGTKYLEELVVWYADHRYEGKLVDGRIDLLNVLPSTI